MPHPSSITLPAGSDMPSSKTTRKRRLTVQPSPRLFNPDEAVVTIRSKYSHVPNHLVGYIDSYSGQGYAVMYRRTVHIGLFGGGAVRRPAIMFMEEKELRKFLPSDRQLILLRLLREGPISVTRAKELFPNEAESHMKGIRVEYDLDDLWDAGLCYCRGEHHDYDYELTDRGQRYVTGL